MLFPDLLVFPVALFPDLLFPDLLFPDLPRLDWDLPLLLDLELHPSLLVRFPRLELFPELRHGSGRCS